MSKRKENDYIREIEKSNMLVALVIAGVIGIGLGLFIGTIIKFKDPDAMFALQNANFYPGRVQGDNSDLTFDFKSYLDHIGAKEINHFVYCNEEGTKQELRFKFDGLDYKIETTSSSDPETHLHCIYTSMTATTPDGIIYGVPTSNCGRIIMDSRSPLVVDWLIFDLFHVATDKSSELHRELSAGYDEDSCPFTGFGIAHYEQWPDNTVIWHDDTTGEHQNLHY